jgi:hypothetical protein
MWLIKVFQSRQAMNEWISKRVNKIQWVEVFINNGYAVEYRRLNRVY